MANAGECRHVERRSHGRSTAANCTRFVHSSAIDVERRHAHETGDLSTIQTAEFRQLRQECTAGDFADTRDRLEELILHSPRFACFDSRSELRIDFGDLPVEHVDDGVDGALDFRETGAMASVEFGGSEVEKLPASRDQSVEFSAVFIGKIAYWGLDVVSEASQDASINAIGFSENAQGMGVIASLAWIDQGDRQLGLVECNDEGNFMASGGLDDDPFDIVFLEDLYEACNALGIVGKGIKTGKWEVDQVE